MYFIHGVDGVVGHWELYLAALHGCLYQDKQHLPMFQ